MFIWRILKQIGRFFRVIGSRFVEDRLTYSASALTFTTLLALVPLMTVSLAILSAFPIFQKVSKGVQLFIFQNFIPTSGKVIHDYLHTFILQAGQLSLVGTIFLMVTAVMMMLTIERALNDVWKIRYRRRVFSAVLRYWAVLSLAPIAVVVSLVVTSYIVSIPLVVGTASVLGLKAALLKSTPIILTVIGFMLLYVVVPNCYVPWRYAFVGAGIATFLFEWAKHLFVLYLKHFATYHLIYGAFSVVPIFLVWIYFLWVIILFGALISNVLTTYYFSSTIGEIDGFMHAFLWLGFLWRAQQDGHTLSYKHLQKFLPGKYQVPADVQMNYLKKLRLVKTTMRQRYLLSRDFSHMTLGELYDLLPWKLTRTKDSHLLPEALSNLFEKAHRSVIDELNMPLEQVYEDLFKSDGMRYNK